MVKNSVISCDAVEFMKTIPKDACVITDPPFNIGFQYKNSSDKRGSKNYRELLRVTCRIPSVVIHYPENMFLVAEALGVSPSKCVAWVYNANTKKQWRMISWFGIRPDFCKVKQPYKNPNDARIKKLMANGSKGTDLYDWWNVQQVKNVSKEKTDHPCQMPLSIMENIVAITKTGLIVDPFAGSGTTLVAAKRLGRDFAGCDISEEYCAIASGRLAGEGLIR